MESQSKAPAMLSQGPPFLPPIWTAGGPPVKRIDVPVQTIFMLLFFIGAIVHMRVFQSNRARAHKFLPNLFIFFFCVSRILTSILRIASVSLPRNAQLALAAQIFMSAGVLILFIINLVFATRILRSTHRDFGWSLPFSILSKIVVLAIGATLITLITTTVRNAYSINERTRATDHTLLLYGSTFLAIIATLPLPIVALTLTIPYSPLDEFGTGRTRTKVIVLVISTTLLSIGAWFRCGIAWQTPVPLSQPLPSYLAKGPFYVLNFLFEFQTVIMYAVLRVDQRFHIPNGAKGPGSYSRPERLAAMALRNAQLASGDDASTLKQSVSIHEEDMDAKSTLELDVDIEKSPSLTVPQPTHPSRRKSHRASLLHAVLTRSPSMSISTNANRSWRASQDSRIIRRLGGPWEELPSPTESTYNSIQTTPIESMFRHSRARRVSAGSVGTTVAAPSIRNTLHEDWTPEIDWELASPRRFLSFKKKSLSFVGTGQ
ncbi:hypothetical protein BKA63DRAFT_97339 [Paraphoma chrysanthemicola]|nr:hypothetical protein BKA63DRAFT_97339 [Paraphoma chrysanthemicola]